MTASISSAVISGLDKGIGRSDLRRSGFRQQAVTVRKRRKDMRNVLCRGAIAVGVHHAGKGGGKGLKWSGKFVGTWKAKEDASVEEILATVS